ncbi:hypothetical protein TREAZ_2521 [Leadbettera azotonutricia ZAS-9]|uniref:Uncharacterized protein n=1 Tax=Leadbettera azotonutricia (strain ATCC BAA-888 / DSM 13862 / ZAS-9) TaxID=545695 RepID=F5YF46_LEAAZ|nr:hypothetical protein TREAZ_2521 [Leadbettera azotonutricia ZAS-9]
MWNSITARLLAAFRPLGAAGFSNLDKDMRTAFIFSPLYSHFIIHQYIIGKV